MELNTLYAYAYAVREAFVHALVAAKPFLIVLGVTGGLLLLYAINLLFIFSLAPTI